MRSLHTFCLYKGSLTNYTAKGEGTGDLTLMPYITIYIYNIGPVGQNAQLAFDNDFGLMSMNSIQSDMDTTRSGGPSH